MAQHDTPRVPLAEITPPHRVTPERGIAPVTTRRTALIPRIIDSPTDNIPDSILSPTLSPEEALIQQRGRRRNAVMWSPDNRSLFPSPMRTPTKSMTSMTLRSSPRKRSLIQELSDVSGQSIGSPAKRLLSPRTSAGCSTTAAKKMKLEESAMNRQNDGIPLETILNGYSKEQLIKIISSLVDGNEQTEKSVRNELPLPDIGPLEAELSKLKKNIFASVPQQKLYSRTDGHGFLRAATHLTTFKQTIHSQSQTLYASRHWDALLDYVLVAWPYVRDTPVYENAKHNAIRRYCFKLLSHHATNALKHGSRGLGQERIVRLQQKLPAMVTDWSEIGDCNRCLDYILKNF
ncbi:uncharacterized protein LOC131215691 [Anopheles bellator]|uniref:uncharacterized protein LOC131215691 n=1 Tax=Anopheles bellator TaxID=139047 RepID=UPI0026485EC3|nr:uncharacterized protein LOC131215691 [Anopheles bellator]